MQQKRGRTTGTAWVPPLFRFFTENWGIDKREVNKGSKKTSNCSGQTNKEEVKHGEAHAVLHFDFPLCRPGGTAERLFLCLTPTENHPLFFAVQRLAMWNSMC